MKLKKFIALMGLLIPFTLAAADPSWLTFKMTDNTELSVAAENLTINYSEAALHLKSATVDESLTVAEIQSMRFTSSPAGINDVTDGRTEEADYFTSAGVKAGRFPSIEEARRVLPSGIYLVKSKSKTIKVIF